jgi:hypothetical protein
VLLSRRIKVLYLEPRIGYKGIDIVVRVVDIRLFKKNFVETGV